MSLEEAILAGLRLTQYAGVAVVLGVPTFLLTAGERLTPPRRARALVMTAALFTSVAALAALAVQTVVMAGSWTQGLTSEALTMVALHTAIGLSMAARAAAAVVALLAVLTFRGRLAWTSAAAAGLVAAVSLAWSGHAGSTEGLGGILHPAADAVHAVAGAVWLGALIALALVVRGRNAADDPAVHAAFRAFGGTGTVAVATLALSGLFNTAFLVGASGVASLTQGAWGVLLLAKLGLFAAMLALAASNRWRLTPALESAQRAGRAHGEPERALRRLRSSVSLESALGLILLAVVAVMGLQPPPIHS